MFLYALIGVGLLLGALFAARWFVAAEPATVLRVLRLSAISVLVIVLMFLLLTGRLNWAFAAMAALIPFLLRVRWAARTAGNFASMGRAARGQGSGDVSTVTTRFLRMTLEHDGGAMNGEVLEGRFRGAFLARLSIEQLLELWNECAADPESQQVLEAYLERERGSEWQAAAQGRRADAGAGTGAMTPDEAYAILGLEPGAAADAVKAAHHRLMSRLHPDHGGSTYLASKLNQARDVLLGMD